MAYQLIVHERYSELRFDLPPGIEEILGLNTLRLTHRRLLLDLSGGINIDINRLVELLTAIDKVDIPADIITAILADDNLDYGLSKIYQDYRSSLGGNVQVFRDKEDAGVWLADF